VEYETLGVKKSHLLVPDGDTVPLTKDNRELFVQVGRMLIEGYDSLCRSSPTPPAQVDSPGTEGGVNRGGLGAKRSCIPNGFWRRAFSASSTHSLRASSRCVWYHGPRQTWTLYT